MAWSEEDRAYTLAWQEFEKDKCSNCGQHLSETMQQQNQWAYDGEVVRCHGCATQNRKVKKFADNGGDQAGAMFQFTRTPNKQR